MIIFFLCGLGALREFCDPVRLNFQSEEFPAKTQSRKEEEPGLIHANVELSMSNTYLRVEAIADIRQVSRDDLDFKDPERGPEG